MQQVLHQDIAALARCLLRVPFVDREAYAARCIEVAAAGDIWRRETGQAHSLFGDGTLQSACSGLPRAGERALDDAEYANCWVVAIYAALEARLAPCAGDTKW